MNKYFIDGQQIDSIELKCLLVSRGVKADNNIYRKYSTSHRINISPLTCNCLLLSDGTIVQLTDMTFHLRYLTGILSWDNLKLLKYASELATPFTLKLADDKPTLFYKNEYLDTISFPTATDFFKRKTSSGLPFTGNAVLQGLDWVAFQCLWPCEYATSGKPCEFCFSGARGKTQPEALKRSDVAEITAYAIENVKCGNIQITGGSTFDGRTEARHIGEYLEAIDESIGISNIPGEILLYITPPSDTALIDQYFSLGASRIACSLELWDEERARIVTPGKMEYTTRKRHLDILQYIANKYGPAKAFSNFIIGIESYESLSRGVNYLAERGILPAASVWMPMGRPVMGEMKAPDIDYYRRVKELYASAYQKYGLEPTASRGLNVCIERDIWNYSCSI